MTQIEITVANWFAGLKQSWPWHFKFLAYWRWSGTGIRDWMFYCLPGVGLMLVAAWSGAGLSS